jgi:hypothetical protein
MDHKKEKPTKHSVLVAAMPIAVNKTPVMALLAPILLFAHVAQSVVHSKSLTVQMLFETVLERTDTVTFLIFGLVRKKSRPKKTGRIR